MVGACLRGLRLGHGSTLPGRVAARVAPGLLRRLVSLPHLRIIVVSGTNGKTTTAHILHHVLTAAGWRAESNPSGANLESGLLTALLTRLPLRAHPGEPLIFVLEVDEAALARLADQLRPQVLVLTNFCRDQLDRYGELDRVAERVRAVMEQLGPTLPAVLNADDPGVAMLGTGRPLAQYFGLEVEAVDRHWSSPLEHYECGDCRVTLVYHQSYLGHFGDWYCPSCGRGRPARQTAATGVVLDDDGEGSTFALRLGGEAAPVHLPLPGLYNVYNALAAATAAAHLGLALPGIARSLSNVTPCFGRGEHQRAGRCELHLFLIKNPAGANTVLETLANREVKSMWLIINDRLADGRDVSWLWDVDFEEFWARNGYPGEICVSGRRALDLAVRLRYAGFPADRLTVLPRISHGLRRFSSHPAMGVCYVLATYTALLDLRDRLGKVRRW